jgi:hypothetical protein
MDMDGLDRDQDYWVWAVIEMANRVIYKIAIMSLSLISLSMSFVVPANAASYSQPAYYATTNGAFVDTQGNSPNLVVLNPPGTSLGGAQIVLAAENTVSADTVSMGSSTNYLNVITANLPNNPTTTPQDVTITVPSSFTPDYFALGLSESTSSSMSRYVYVVSVTDTSGNTTTFSNPDYTPPGPSGSTNLAGSVVSNNTVSLNWTYNGSDSVTGYNLVYWDVTNGATSTDGEQQINNATSPFSLSNLNGGDTYGFYVVPYNANGNGNPSNTIQLTLTQPALAITPQTSTVQVGGTQAYTVTLQGTNSQSTNVTSLSTFTSSNSSVASISGSTATGVAAGTVTITASYQGQVVTATLTIAGAQTPPVPPNPPSSPTFNTSGDFFHQLTDTILGPATNFLEYAIEKINSVSLIASQGLNLDNFLGPIAALGPAWVAMIVSLVGALLLITIVFIARQVYNLWVAILNGIGLG